MTSRLGQLSKQIFNMAAKTKTDIHLYTTGTPNGIKVSILLEELGLEYQVTPIDISKNTQKVGIPEPSSCTVDRGSILNPSRGHHANARVQEPWFLEINPNGRIPALTDKFEDGKTIRLFESGSILQYLVDRYDKDHKVSYPYGSREYWEVNNWV